jgi:hypothetical protein
MHLTIRHFDGRLVDSIILAVSADRMRIAIPGSEDTIELALRQGVWLTENGEPVEIESMISPSDPSAIFAGIIPTARLAAASTVI